MTLASAVCISMSIPFFFIPKKACYRTEQGQLSESINSLYIDGGVNDNYPIWLFDKKKYRQPYPDDETPIAYNDETLGFKLVDFEQWEILQTGNSSRSTPPIDDFVKFAKAVIYVFYNKQLSDHRLSDDKNRTIYINTSDIQTTDFKLTLEQKNRLKEAAATCILIPAALLSSSYEQEIEAVKSLFICSRNLVILPHRPPVGTRSNCLINSLNELPKVNSWFFVLTASVVIQAISSLGIAPYGRPTLDGANMVSVNTPFFLINSFPLTFL